MGKLFGTDGVRGIANVELTPSLAFHLGQAGAYVLSKEQARPRIIIGKDTRISCDMLEAALVAGICSVGADVWKVGVLPTPGIAYLTRTLGVSAGVVISASHNPVADNGIKFFSAIGYKLPDVTEEEIERIVRQDAKPWPEISGKDIGRVIEVKDAERRYIDFLKSTMHNRRLDGLKVVLDCANGAASQVGPALLRELGVQVIPIFHEPDGVNINDRCGSTHMEELQQAVVRYGAHMGLANDGDADRLLAVDEQGRLVDGDRIMVICAMARKEKDLDWDPVVVVTVMSNLGLHQALKASGIRVVETQVGDRYVVEELLRSGATFGGEQSGHIIFLEYNTTGDGLLTALQLLSIVKDKDQPFSLLADQMKRLPQILVNTRVKGEHKDRLMRDAEILAKVKQASHQLGEQGRIFVRASGTESLIRVMAEGPDERMLQDLVRDVSDFVKQKDLALA
ncbi:MAG: phosphoglucosamine mutase [Peptococcaceae bacterium]|jgi:phosphoglucosamine mutase|nr:phosphoglucosamine mutase [Peptococcaceae bacterium]